MRGMHSNQIIILIFTILIICSCSLFTPNKDPNNIMDWVTIPEDSTKLIFEDKYFDITGEGDTILKDVDTVFILYYNKREDSNKIVFNKYYSYDPYGYTDDSILYNLNYLVIDKEYNQISLYADDPYDEENESLFFEPLMVCPIERGAYWDSKLYANLEYSIGNTDTIVTTKYGELETVQINTALASYTTQIFHYTEYYSFEYLTLAYQKSEGTTFITEYQLIDVQKGGVE